MASGEPRICSICYYTLEGTLRCLRCFPTRPGRKRKSLEPKYEEKWQIRRREYLRETGKPQDEAAS